MSVHPFRLPRNPVVPVAFDPALASYYSADPVPLPALRLRPMTALDQMYAYWGSDRA